MTSILRETDPAKAGAPDEQLFLGFLACADGFSDEDIVDATINFAAALCVFGAASPAHALERVRVFSENLEAAVETNYRRYAALKQGQA